MQRLHSTMTAAELQAWIERHQHTWASACEALGVSRNMLAEYLRDQTAIPATAANLCAALDQLAERPVNRARQKR